MKDKDLKGMKLIEQLVEAVGLNKQEQEKTVKELWKSISELAVGLLLLKKEPDERAKLIDELKSMDGGGKIEEYTEKNWSEEEIGGAFARATERVMEEYLAVLLRELDGDRQMRVIEKMSVIIGKSALNHE